MPNAPTRHPSPRPSAARVGFIALLVGLLLPPLAGFVLDILFGASPAGWVQISMAYLGFFLGLFTGPIAGAGALLFMGLRALLRGEHRNT
ncbi:hypothetical protein [Pyxidicoccus caerfyrddinensis]|jgi:uncharacterized membrane protein YqaE (UPF0057 family)|uniref:hypothetical protein n=1 Tax=Pyxidicoccus caerfyrddinensis TaxID=2709663 RepID=UPI0013DC64BD|nr:hypothetical protein [Pyxidicoccus caerfyrddinensis]